MIESGAVLSAREQSVRRYFDMWLRRDCSGIETIFAEDAVYIESDGKEYRGAGQLARWFGDWHRHGSVERWDVTAVAHSGSRSYIEWIFVCVYDGVRSEFDGVTVAEFNEDGRISMLREFAAAHDRVRVYEE